MQGCQNVNQLYGEFIILLIIQSWFVLHVCQIVKLTPERIENEYVNQFDVYPYHHKKSSLATKNKNQIQNSLFCISLINLFLPRQRLRMS